MECVNLTKETVLQEWRKQINGRKVAFKGVWRDQPCAKPIL